MRNHRLALDALRLASGLTPDILAIQAPPQRCDRSVNSTQQRLINQRQNSFEQEATMQPFLYSLSQMFR